MPVELPDQLAQELPEFSGYARYETCLLYTSSPVAEAPAIQTVRQLAEALYERVNL